MPDAKRAGNNWPAKCSCHAVAVKVKVLQLPNLPVKGDISDWLDAGGTRDQLVALVKGTPLYEPPATSSNSPSAPSTAASHPGAILMNLSDVGMRPI